jgi:hypothetical protein
MIFTEDGVDLPEELLTSLAEGRLVLFAGAGVSARAFPTQPQGTFYPLFPELVREVALRLGRTLSKQEEKDIESGLADRVLGTFDASLGDVNGIAADILTERYEQQRIDFHRAIVRLVKTSPRPQIVTTNFDRLLERAVAEERGSSSNVWQITVAPSLLPLRRFSGICYLHGRVDVQEDLVLTDKHIGRAYMDEGWALRFAHTMFRERDILFVGYSLDDPPLRYLSLALEGESTRHRWAFVRTPDEEANKEIMRRDWERRNVTPIWYTGPKGDFRALEKTIDVWASNTSKTFLDRRNVLALFGATDPRNLAPHDLALASYFLKDTATLRDFAGTELHLGWLDKFLEWRIADDVVKPASVASEAAGALLQRFAKWLCAEPVEVCGLLARYRAALHPGLFDQLCRSGAASSLSTQIFRQLLEFFRPSLERSPSFLGFVFVDSVIGRLVNEGLIDDALWLLGLSLRVQCSVTAQESFEFEYARLEGRTTVDMAEKVLRFNMHFDDQLASHRFGHVVQKVLRPRIGEIGVQTLHWFTGKLLEIRATEARGLEKVLSTDFVRSAIEDHEQDRHRHDPINTIVVAIRDLWEALYIASPSGAEQVCQYWQTLTDPMIERLRIHALRKMIEGGNGFK